jgi:hypothetical protein
MATRKLRETVLILVLESMLKPVGRKLLPANAVERARGIPVGRQGQGLQCLP